MVRERLDGGEIGLSKFRSSEVVGEFLGGSGDGSRINSVSEESTGGIGDGDEEISGRLSVLRSEKEQSSAKVIRMRRETQRARER